jgi:Protein of unknown function (DUF3616)
MKRLDFLKDKGRRDYTLNPTTRGPTNGVQFKSPPDAPSMAGQRGVNIEGITVRDGKLFFGFRGPAEGGRVPVLSVDARALFTRSDPGPLVTMLKVGKGRGIRDMTVVRDGVLLLAGPDDDEANAERGWIVALWKNDELGRRDAEPEVLGMLDLSSVDRRDCDKELKPEAMAVIADTNDWLDIVVMSDGMCDGGPLKFSIHRSP